MFFVYITVNYGNHERYGIIFLRRNHYFFVMTWLVAETRHSVNTTFIAYPNYQMNSIHMCYATTGCHFSRWREEKGVNHELTTVTWLNTSNQ